jgi:predicted enzyme related to lactoylglutathione lyase
MSEDRYIAGVPCWVDTTQPDPDGAAAFYGDLLGWEIENVMPPDAPVKYLIARIGGGDVAAISSPVREAPPKATWNTYVWVDDADATAAKVREAGGAVLNEPFDVMDFGRMGVFADPSGAVFCVWQPKEHRGAAVVNEPGSLNFNTLNTRDVEGASRFYGAVFGWDLVDGAGAPMWALPAYGEFLERRTPGRRENMAAMGAPPRFDEVVAAAMPIPDDQPDTPPHWGVTFAVEDADAVASRAAELGGQVVLPPVDAPWVRTTVITDPQGATFTASKFVPENKDLPQGAEAAGSAHQ